MLRDLRYLEPVRKLTRREQRERRTQLSNILENSSINDLNYLGIRKEERVNTWSRVWDARVTYTNREAEVSGKRRFESVKNVEQTLQRYWDYKALMEGDVYNQIEALGIAREELGKAHIIERAEEKVADYCLERLDNTVDSIKEVRSIVDKAHIQDKRLLFRLKNAEENLGLYKERKACLKELLNGDLPDNLREQIYFALQDTNVVTRTSPRILYPTLMKVRNSLAAEEALSFAVEARYSASLLKRAFTKWNQRREAEPVFYDMIESPTPKNLLAAFNYANANDISPLGYGQIFANLTEIEALVPEQKEWAEERLTKPTYECVLENITDPSPEPQRKESWVDRFAMWVNRGLDKIAGPEPAYLRIN